jgi:REP element-mobilizing transposase RayT
LPQVWDIITKNLLFYSQTYDFEVHAFVLMNNHFHLLAYFRQNNLSEAMKWFIGSTSQHINFDRQRINQVFGRRFKRCQLKSMYHYLNTYKYIYQNPIRAKICEKVEQYPYSTLRGRLGLARLELPLYDDVLGTNEEQVLVWLNELPPAEKVVQIKRALQRTEFHLPVLKNKRPNPLENSLI